MFVAIYRWRLRAGLEQDFVANWQRITARGLQAGSGGSSLFKESEEQWVAIARWPSREARQQFFEQFEREDDDPQMRESARAAVVESFPPQELNTVLDMWSPIAGEAVSGSEL